MRLTSATGNAAMRSSSTSLRLRPGSAPLEARKVRNSPAITLREASIEAMKLPRPHRNPARASRATGSGAGRGTAGEGVALGAWEGTQTEVGDPCAYLP